MVHARLREDLIICWVDAGKDAMSKFVEKYSATLNFYLRNARESHIVVENLRMCLLSRRSGCDQGRPPAREAGGIDCASHFFAPLMRQSQRRAKRVNSLYIVPSTAFSLQSRGFLTGARSTDQNIVSASDSKALLSFACDITSVARSGAFANVLIPATSTRNVMTLSQSIAPWPPAHLHDHQVEQTTPRLGHS
jgi:hypothetical protein